MDKTDIEGFEATIDDKKLWIEEIVRETEHYYQGEMQQEERASWLLGTASALMAIFISSFSAFIEKNPNEPKILFLIPLGSFFISAVIAILGVIPYRGTKGIRILFFNAKSKPENLPINEFVNLHFHLDESWSKECFKNRIFFHFRSHYLRNHQKSRLVIWSAGFLLIGLFTSLLIVWYMII